MTKNGIRMTESDLDRIASKTVNQMLNEGSGTVQRFEKAYGILKNACESGYIPFVSSNPSDTDNEIKNAIFEVMRLIAKACYLDSGCYGNEPVAHAV